MAFRLRARHVMALWIAGAVFLASPDVLAAESEAQQVIAEPPQYELGQGLRLGNSGFTLGGYSSLQYEDVRNSPSQGGLSHLSMFVWWEGESRVKFFSEIDNQDSLAADDQASDDSGRFLSIERLYFEYAFDDAVSIRLGKFLTPIGRWNQIHADPLVWTTSRPLITVNMFPEHASGGMLLGNVDVLGHRADYMLYASTGTDVRKDPAENPFNEAFGARLNFPAGQNLQWGLSIASFDQTANVEEHEMLIGTDFVWASHGFELSGEGIYRKSSLGSGRDAHGGFLQGVVPLYGKLFGVGRIEDIHNPAMQEDARLVVLGLNYRQSRALSLKLELIRGVGQDITAPGVLTSVSVLF